MKKLYILTLLLAMTITASAQTVDGRNFGIDGFAAYEGTANTNWYHAGGTTGGQGGKVVYANTFPELQAYLQSSEPYIVLVDHDITTGIKCYIDASSTGHLCDNQDGSEGVESTYGERILIASNKTLIGIADKDGNAPLFSRITFVMQSVSNIIIRNCRFTMVGAPILKSGENKIIAWRDGAQSKVGDPDCIGIQADKNSANTDFGSHIWIDHCEFFNGDAEDVDRYDGLLDCKNNVQWLTFSYNLFHDHFKACLWGKGDSDCYDDCRTISAHHNVFKNIVGSRLPLQRGGYLHYMNNYMENASDGWDVRTQAVGYADACYFKNSKAPIRLRNSEGVININQDPEYSITYDNCLRIIANQDFITYKNISKTDEKYDWTSYKSTWVPTDTWSGYYVNNHDKTADVPTVCGKYSGAGKIEIWKTYADAIPAESADDYKAATRTQETEACYDENGNKVAGINGSGSGSSSGSSSDSGSGSDSDSSSSSYIYDFTGKVGSTDGKTGACASFTDNSSVKLGDSNQYMIISPKSGESFKNGDKVTVVGSCGSASKNMGVYLNIEAKKAGSAIYTAAASTETTYTATGTLSLTANADKLYVFRYDATSTTITGLKIEHAVSTGINSIESISSTNIIYDLLGRRISSPVSGQLYIMNGKKYIGK